MEEVKIEYFKYLPTEERRQAAKRLKKYMEYFQAELSAIEKYEVRVFLSLDSADENYYIQKPMDYFLEKTKGKIVPIGLDSGDNYYCVNNETGKVYYWSAGEDSYYCIAESIMDFIELFK